MARRVAEIQTKKQSQASEKKGEGVGFKEAKKTLVCRKLYKQTLDTNLMPQDIVEKHYPNGDVHDMYIAEVLEIIE